MTHRNYKILLSFGIGRLHFVQATEALIAIGLDVKVVQGWVPRKFLSTRLLDKAGLLIGKPNLSRNLEKRNMTFLQHQKNVSIALPEFIEQTQRLFKPMFRAQGIIQKASWGLFGRLTRNHLSNIDILHVRSGAGGGGCIDKARQLGALILVDHSIAHIDFLSDTFQDLPNDSYNRVWMNRDNPFWQQVMQDCAKADMIVVNSEFVKKTFVDAGFSQKNISVVYLGVREDFLFLKTSYDMNSKARLLFTGTFGWRKGADFVLDALCQMNEKGIDFVFRAVGAVEDEFLHDVRVQALGDKFEFTGHVHQDELKEHLAWADLYVFPSLAEGCASSGMEAIASGLPTIGTVESGLPITHLETGYIIPRKDENAIFEAILTLLNNKKLREKLGIAGANMLRDHFTWRNYACDMRSVYEHLNARSAMRCTPCCPAADTTSE